MASEEAKKQEKAATEHITFEEDDTFEEFTMPDGETTAAEDEGQGLWQPDWDDEDNKEDFLGKLKGELGADSMKE